MLAHIIQVEHRSDGIDAQAIDMMLAQPEERASDQEVAHLAAPIIEDIRTPLFVLALARIGVLVEMCPIKVAQGRPIFGEVRGDPVEQDADALLVHVVDEILEILRRTVTAGWCKVARRLVAPGAVERIFGDGQQLDMRKAQVFHIVCQGMRQLAIGHKAIFFVGAFLMPLWNVAPGTQVDLVDRDGLAERPKLFSPLQPCLVLPGVLMDIGDDAGCPGAQFGEKAIGIGLIDRVVVEARIDGVLVDLAGPESRHKALPNAQVVVAALHRRLRAIPAVEVADRRDGACIRRPERKIDARDSMYRAELRAELIVDVVVPPLPKQVEVEIAKDRWYAWLYLRICELLIVCDLLFRFAARLLWRVWCSHLFILVV